LIDQLVLIMCISNMQQIVSYISVPYLLTDGLAD